MPLNARLAGSVLTPALVLDEQQVRRDLETAVTLRDQCRCKLLYALKPLTCEFVLEWMVGKVDGFAVSSLFESRLAREVISSRGTVHLTTPGLRDDELFELGELCDFISFNSLSQLRRLAGSLEKPGQIGLRVNPELSFVNDDRYNPCRPLSKLGVPLDSLARRWEREPQLFQRVSGVLFHNNCDATSFEPLHRTVKHVETALGEKLSRLSWINLGGGYLLDEPEAVDLLAQSVERLESRHGLCVYVEPGAALVRKAGYLVASVIDLFRFRGTATAVLDTTVNHVPEAFEYQFEPDVQGHDDDGEYEYVLAGSSCLAGDVLGVYAFDRRLSIGSRVVLANVGAYSIVKAHMFNGINLPSIYSVSPTGELILRRRFTYDDFISRFGACSHAAV
jgi:carboxynorspermidine decarboxylase